MKPINIIACAFVLLSLTGCAHGHSDLKAPCGPSAGLSRNPCDHIPMNFAAQNPIQEQFT